MSVELGGSGGHLGEVVALGLRGPGAATVQLLRMPVYDSLSDSRNALRLGAECDKTQPREQNPSMGEMRVSESLRH